MNKHSLISFTAILGIAGCWCLLTLSHGMATSSEDAKTATSSEHTKESRFNVVPMGQSACLVDVSSGKTWILRQRSDGTPGWFRLPFFGKEDALVRLGGGFDHQGAFQTPSLSLQALLKGQGYTRIKLEPAASGYLRITGRIYQKPVSLVVDSGAPITHLDRVRTKDLGLKWQKEWGEIHGEKIGVPYDVCFTSIELGSLRTGMLRIGNHDLSEINNRLEPYGDSPVDGVLGLDVLNPFMAVIDYKEHNLYMIDRGFSE